MSSPTLQAEYLAEGQSHAEVTVNEALNRIDALIQINVRDRDLSAPPGSPANGSVYLVAAGGSGAWTGRDGQLAMYYDGWLFVTPKEGCSVWVADEDVELTFDGTSWVQTGSPLVARNPHEVNIGPASGVDPAQPTWRTLALADLPVGTAANRAAYIDATGTVTAPAFSGGGAGLTGLNADQLTSGTIPSARLPAVAISEFLGEVADEAAMLALVGQRGDYCLRSDTGDLYQLTTDDPTQAGNWLQVVKPHSPVTSVNGYTGSVMLGISDFISAQNANLFYCGPASGGPAAPTFRAIENADLPRDITVAGKLAVTGGFAAGVASAAYAGTITPDVDSCSLLNVGTLSGDLTIANPAGTPKDGQTITFRLTQDASGNRAITWGDAWAFGKNITKAGLPTAANADYEIGFRYHAASGKYRAVAFEEGPWA